MKTQFLFSISLCMTNELQINSIIDADDLIILLMLKMGFDINIHFIRNTYNLIY